MVICGLSPPPWQVQRRGSRSSSSGPNFLAGQRPPSATATPPSASREVVCVCVCARGAVRGRSLRRPCARCTWSTAAIFGGILASVSSCVRWCVVCSTRRSRRRSRPRGARSLIGERRAGRSPCRARATVRVCGRVWVSYRCGMRTVSTVLCAGSAVDTKIRVLESFLTLNLSLITNSISGVPSVSVYRLRHIFGLARSRVRGGGSRTTR